MQQINAETAKQAAASIISEAQEMADELHASATAAARDSRAARAEAAAIVAEATVETQQMHDAALSSLPHQN